MRTFISTVVLVLASCFLGTAEAQTAASGCVATLDGVSNEGVRTYIPFGSLDTVSKIDLALTATANCALRVAFRGSSTALQGPGGTLNYALQSASGQALLDTGIQIDGLQPGVNGSSLYTIYAMIPAGQSVSPGVYQGSIRVQLLDGDALVGERELVLSASVLSQASISVAGSSTAGFTSGEGSALDFGTLERGTQREVFLFVRSNNRFLLEFRSENGGRLRHATEHTELGWIGYAAQLDGSLLDLSQRVSVGPLGLFRQVFSKPYRLSVTIGDVEGRLAGRYRDTITVDVVVLD